LDEIPNKGIFNFFSFFLVKIFSKQELLVIVIFFFLIVLLLLEMSLSLKVYIISTGASRNHKFPPDISVQEALKDIREKSGVGGEDHGLFLPAGGKKGGRWLKENTTLLANSLESGVKFVELLSFIFFFKTDGYII
jgi:hypothetical protein